MSTDMWAGLGIGFTIGLVGAFAISAATVALLFRYRWGPHAMAEERVHTGLAEDDGWTTDLNHLDREAS